MANNWWENDPVAQAPRATGAARAAEPENWWVKDSLVQAAPEVKPEARPEDQSFLRSVADVPLGVAKGVASGVRMIADAFGANTPVANTIKGVEDYVADLMSAQSKNDSREIARIQKEAEDKGALEQVKAAFKALSVAPIDILTQVLGTAAPVIVGSVGATLAGAPVAAVGVGAAGLGAVMGAGTIKSTIFDATKEELMKAKVPEAEANKIAEQAQEYGGKNLDSILLGAGFGVLGGTTGIEPAIAKAMAGRIMGKAATEAAKREAIGLAEKKAAEAAAKQAAKGRARRGAEGALTEGVPEFLQAGQEKIAENIALQREGYDVPTMRGVVGAAAFEGLAGAGLGAGIGARGARRPLSANATKEDRRISALDAEAELQGATDEFQPPEPRTAGAANVPGAGEPSDGLFVPPEATAGGAAEPDAGALGGTEPAANQLTERETAELSTLTTENGRASNQIAATLSALPDGPAQLGRLDNELTQAVAALPPDATYLDKARAESAVLSSFSSNLAAQTPTAKAVERTAVSTDTEGVTEEPPVPEGYVRVYHSGMAGEGETGRWVSTNKEYASSYRRNLPLFFTDVPASDPRVNNPDYADQSSKQGFTFNFELTPAEAATLKEIPRPQSSQTGAAPTPVETTPSVGVTPTGTAFRAPEPQAAAATAAAPLTVTETKTFTSAAGNSALEVSLSNGAVTTIEQLTDSAGKKGWFYEGADPTEGADSVQYLGNTSKKAIASLVEAAPEAEPQTQADQTQTGETKDEAEAEAEAKTEAEEEAADEARQAQAEADVDAGPIGQAIAKLEDGDFDKKSDVKKLAKKLEKDGYIDDTSDIDEIVRDREQDVSDVIQQLESQLDDARDAAIEERKAELDEEAESAKPLFAEQQRAGEPNAAEIEKLNTSVARVTSINEAVAEAIRNNDLNGALRAIARNLTGFYSELATRLADLNLPAKIGFNKERLLTRKAIDDKTGAAQNRLFQYIELTYPALYGRYFKDFEKESRLEDVYQGLLFLNSGKYAVGPVRSELTAVLEAYNNNMPALRVPGVFFPQFDSISLTTDPELLRMSVGRVTYRTTLHEVLHAATYYVINANEADLTAKQLSARKKLQEMFKYAQTKLSKDDHYGMTDIHEFVSELFTNKLFQEALKAIPYKNTNTSIFTRFIRAILDVFGVENLAGNAMLQANELFSADRPSFVRNIGPLFAKGKKGKKGKSTKEGPATNPKSWRTRADAAASYIARFNAAIKGREKWEDVLRDTRKAVWSTGTGAYRAAMLPLANLRQLGDLTRTKFPMINGAINAIEKMLADRGMRLKRVEDITKRWADMQRKDPAQSRLMGRIMLEARIREIDPDTAMPGQLSRAFEEAWNELDNNFKQLYRDVRNFYKLSLTEMIGKITERAKMIPLESDRAKALKEINDQFGPGKLKGPYFPFRRFGQYSYQVGKGEKKEFYMFESRGERDLSFQQRFNELEKGTAAQRALAGSMYKSNSISEMFNKNATSEVFKEITNIIDTATSTTAGDLKEELRDSLNQLVYVLLPQQSMKKMFLHSKSVQGASEDMLRVFATSGVHTAYQQSRFNHAEDFMNQLTNADEYIKTSVDPKQRDVYDDFVKEVKARSKTILGAEDTSFAAQLAGKASEATFFFMLSAPFTALLNTIGFAQFTMPYLGGRYGYKKANAALLKNMGRYFATAPSRTFAPASEGNIMQMQFPSLVEGGKLDPTLEKAAKRFIADGQINISMTNDAMDLGSQPSELYTGRWSNVKKVMSGLFHQSERLNREVALMTTFELAYEKFLKEPQKLDNGIIVRDKQGSPVLNTETEAFDLAIAEAKDIAGLTLGDFSRQFKPRFFTAPLPSVLFKFKQYAVMATYATMRNLYLTLAEPFNKKETEQIRAALTEQYKNAENRDELVEQGVAEAEAQRVALYKEARRRLAGILGVAFLLGGVEAQPFFWMLGSLLSTLAGPSDDEDEFFDWENWFRNYMEENVGGAAGAIFAKMGMEEKSAEKVGRAVGESIARGPVGTVIGGSLASRTSIDLKNLWFRDGRNSPDIRANAVEAMIANAGPVVGLGMNTLDAYQLMSEGHYQRAFEKALPAIVAKPITAERLASEGATTKAGATLIDEFTAWELGMQAIGLQPERLAQKQKAAIETTSKNEKIKAKHTAIMNRLWLERDSEGGFQRALDDAIEFSQRHPGMRITPSKIMESFKRRAKANAETTALGAKMDKGLRPELMDMPNYGME